MCSKVALTSLVVTLAFAQAGATLRASPPDSSGPNVGSPIAGPGVDGVYEAGWHVVKQDVSGTLTAVAKFQVSGKDSYGIRRQHWTVTSAFTPDSENAVITAVSSEPSLQGSTDDFYACSQDFDPGDVATVDLDDLRDCVDDSNGLSLWIPKRTRISALTAQFDPGSYITADDISMSAGTVTFGAATYGCEHSFLSEDYLVPGKIEFEWQGSTSLSCSHPSVPTNAARVEVTLWPL